MDGGYGSFRRGSIRRVWMKNFLTYDDCEVFPGAHLNVVIGPNGSGKSALTHAICLACCGSTDDIGRANELSKFVKHGTPPGEETFVEVDLFDSGHKWITVRLTLSAANNRSSWLMNGKTAKLENVKSLMQSLSIDVDNLCSFMPQDRVGAFSQYNGKEILQNTLKSIRVPNQTNLFEEQAQLSNLENEREKLRRDRDAIQKKHDDLQRELEGLQGEIGRMKRKDEAVQRKKLLTVKMLFLQCQDLKAVCDAKKAELEVVKGELEAKKKELKDLENEQRKLKQLQDRLRSSSAKSSSSNASTVSAQLIDVLSKAKQSVEEGETNLEDQTGSVRNLASKRQRAEQRLAEVLREINHLETQYREAEEAQPALQQRIVEATAMMKSLKEEAQSIADIIDGLESNSNSFRAEAQRSQRELEALRDARQLYRQRLQSRREQVCGEAIKAMDFLERNLQDLKARGRIKGEVVGPVGLHCRTNNPICAAILERCVPLNRLMGFLVENKEDAQQLQRILRDEQRIGVDIYTIQDFSVLRQPRPYRSEEMQQFRAVGIEGYLADEVQCSDFIRTFLYSFASLQFILWGERTQEIESRQCASLCPARPGSALRMFINYPSEHSIIEYNVKRSRFAPQNYPSISSAVVPPGRGLLSNDSDGGTSVAQRRQQLEAEIENNRRSATQAMEQINKEKSRKQQLDTDFAVQKKIREEAMNSQREPNTLKRRLQDQEREKQRLEQQLSGDIEAEKAALRKKMVAQMDKLLDRVAEGFRAMDRGFELTYIKNCSALKKHAVEGRLTAVTDQVDELRMECQVLRNRVDKLEVAIEKAENNFREKETRLEEIMLETGAEEFDNVLFPAAMANTPMDLQTVEQNLLDVEAEIDAIVDNPGLIQRADAIQRELEECRSRIESTTDAHESAEVTLRQRKDDWLRSVRTLRDRLHALFQKYMQELRFDGEVQLREQGSFLDYELCLMVKFRSEAPLTQLSAQKHSGGERAVSTIMFLMALQDLTPAPFRVVDEINQGMDERNERLVVERIVRNCCDTDGEAQGATAATAISNPSFSQKFRPQYFLITPKLLPALISLRRPDVTILCVRSGAGLLSPKWTFAEAVEAYLQSRPARKRLVRDIADDTDKADHLQSNKKQRAQEPRAVSAVRPPVLPSDLANPPSSSSSSAAYQKAERVKEETMKENVHSQSPAVVASVRTTPIVKTEKPLAPIFRTKKKEVPVIDLTA